MAERTMLLRNVPKDCSADQISQEFKQFTVKRIMNEAPTTGRAYIEFYDPSDIEVVAAKYPDCVIPALNSAEL
jgi:RNA recognition motif-containing protein